MSDISSCTLNERARSAIVPDIISDSSKVECLCLCPWVDNNALLLLSLFIGYENSLNNSLLMSAHVEDMRSYFVLSVLPGSFRRQLFNRDFVADVVITVVVSVAAAATVVVWKV